MKLDDADPVKKSKKLEKQLLQRCKFDPASTEALEALLLDMYNVLHPREVDYEHRRHLIYVVNSFAKQIYGNQGGFPKVEALGSFVMGVFTPKSDLDLSLNFDANEISSFPPKQRASALRKIAKILYARQRKGNVTGVTPVLRARVPVLKFTDCVTRLECDISVENKDGISRSSMVNLMCQVDPRLRILCFLVKVWAKSQMINSAKDRTLNSLSLMLLVTLHLQTRNPPILPPFSALLKDGQHTDKVQNVVNEFKDFGKANKECLSELFLSFFIKISSVRDLWKLGLSASTFKGSWIYKQPIKGNINVEDFLDRDENCARAVGGSEVALIYDCIDRSLDKLQRFNSGHTNGPDLGAFLFGPTSLHVRDQDDVFKIQGPPEGKFSDTDFGVDHVNAPFQKKMLCAEPVGRPIWPNSGHTIGPDPGVFIFGSTSLHGRDQNDIFKKPDLPKRKFSGIDFGVDHVNAPLHKKMHYAEPRGRPTWPNCSEVIFSNPQCSIPPPSYYHTAYQSMPRVMMGPTHPSYDPWPRGPSLPYWPENRPPFPPRDLW